MLTLVLMQLDQSRIHLNFDATVDTDADAWWLNLKQCSLFLSSVNMRVNGKVNADARCEWALSSIPCLYFSLVERML